MDKVAEYFKRLDKIRELADSIKNHKRQTVYCVVTAVSGITCYALTRVPEAGLAGATLSGALIIIDNEFQDIKKERTSRENHPNYTSRNQDA